MKSRFSIMRFIHLSLAFFAISPFAGVVLAQETPAAPQIPAALSAEEQNRLELATRMHEIWPIRMRVESALDAVAGGFPPERQAEGKARLRQSVKYDLLEEESIKSMADIFTAQELQAMIDFYGSEVGKSISTKTADYELLMRPAMVRMLDKAVLDLRLGDGAQTP